MDPFGITPEADMDMAAVTSEPSAKEPERRIVITTWGSLGDLYPYLAIGAGLKARGHDVILATAECYRRKVEGLGLGFRAVRPDCTWLTEPRMVRRLSHPRWGMIRVARRVLPALRESYEDTLAAAEGADLLVGNLATYATGLVAEQKGLPWASVMHIPTLFYSAFNPPLLPGFPGVSKKLRFLGPAFWGPLGRSLKWGSRPLARPWHRLRRQIGLPPVRGVNPLTDWYSPVLHLASFSKWLVDKQPDWPAQTVITGFPWFDRDGSARLPPALAQFLDSGPPPIVFTLGTAVAADAGAFYECSVQAARSIGRRAVLILSDPRNRPPTLPDGVAAFDFAPFSELFPRAAAIVHHGGVGTTGLAMRSGRPMLVMPCAWDQPDNAERAARLGIARTIARHRYTPARVAAELRRLLEDPAYGRRASEVGEQVRQEDGVRVACDALRTLLRTGGSAPGGMKGQQGAKAERPPHGIPHAQGLCPRTPGLQQGSTPDT
jgi:rhamnosyltransferase subunit B